MGADRFTTLCYNGNRVQSLEGFDTRNAGLDGLNRWIDIGSLEDRAAIEQLGTQLGIHRLIVEDILNPGQMVKLDRYDDCLFLVIKMIRYDSSACAISTEHVCLLLKKGIVVSIAEDNTDLFSEVREMIMEEHDAIRRQGVDYLFYMLLDTVVDHYFDVIDALGDATDSVEEQLISAPDPGTLQRIYFIKRELMVLRKSVNPLREKIGDLVSETSLLRREIRIYLHDVYDHLVQTSDSIETYQDILSNMLDTYLSSVSNRTNDTMKILTIISTIFIPLTFLAGIYGMNFKNIPELSLSWGYALFWLVSIVIVILMVLFFHKKKWF